jgi:hypothetical protein
MKHRILTTFFKYADPVLGFIADGLHLINRRIRDGK